MRKNVLISLGIKHFRRYCRATAATIAATAATAAISAASPAAYINPTHLYLTAFTTT
jgi:hypothetical protein